MYRSTDIGYMYSIDQRCRLGVRGGGKKLRRCPYPRVLPTPTHIKRKVKWHPRSHPTPDIYGSTVVNYCIMYISLIVEQKDTRQQQRSDSITVLDNYLCSRSFTNSRQVAVAHRHWCGHITRFIFKNATLSDVHEQSFRQILQKVLGTQKKPTGSARERAKSERVQACRVLVDTTVLRFTTATRYQEHMDTVETRRALVTSRRTVWLSVARFQKALDPVFFARSSHYKKHRNITVIV